MITTAVNINEISQTQALLHGQKMKSGQMQATLA